MAAWITFGLNDNSDDAVTPVVRPRLGPPDVACGQGTHQLDPIRLGLLSAEYGMHHAPISTKKSWPTATCPWQHDGHYPVPNIRPALQHSRTTAFSKPIYVTPT